MWSLPNSTSSESPRVAGKSRVKSMPGQGKRCGGADRMLDARQMHMRTCGNAQSKASGNEAAHTPLFFRSSARAIRAALTRGARVASGSAVCMKAC